MAIFCSRYLTSHPFAIGLRADAIQELALTGYYGFLDYASAFWQDHVEFVITSDSGLDADLKADVLRSAKHLLEVCFSSDPEDDTSRHTLTECTILSDIKEWRSTSSEAFGILERTAAIRKVTEAIDHATLADRALATFLELNGIVRFKCPKIRCLKFAAGFTNQPDRDLHILEHERPFKCSAEGCYARATGYSSQPALDAHFRRLHGNVSNKATLFPQSGRMKESTVHSAASKGNLEEVKILHNLGVPLNEPKKARGGLTPMVCAVRNGHADVCEYLMRQGVNPHTERHRISPIFEAIKRQDLELFSLLQHTAYPLNIDKLAKQVATAVATGSNEILEQLLAMSSPAIIRDKFSDILYLICFMGNAKLDQDTISQLQTQIRLHHRVFRQAFPSLYELDGTTLRHNFRTLCVQLEFNPQHFLSKSTGGGDTLLHHACAVLTYSVVEFLLDLLNPEHLSITNKRQQTPLHFLARRRDEKTEFLKTCTRSLAHRLVQTDMGVAANMKDKDGNLPLHLALSADSQIFPVLVHHTKNLDEENNVGETALELALAHHSIRRVSLLVQSGRVDLTRKTTSGETALSMAARLGNKDILELLDPSRRVIPDPVEPSADREWTPLNQTF